MKERGSGSGARLQVRDNLPITIRVSRARIVRAPERVSGNETTSGARTGKGDCEQMHRRRTLKRILFLAPQPFFSNRGTTIAELETVRILCARGWSVDFLTYSQGEDVVIPGCTIHRIPRIPLIRHVPPGFSLRKVISDLVLFARCRSMILRNRYDLVHAVEESAFIAMVMKWLYGIPFVYDMDSSLPRQFTQQVPVVRPLLRVLEAIEGLVVRRSLAVLTMCRTLEQRARRHAPRVLVGRVEDMAMVDGETGSERLEQYTGGAPTLLYVGNLMPYQGIELLLQALRRAATRVPDLQLVIIGGDDVRRRYYEGYAEGLEIADRIHFIGPRPLDRLGWYLSQATVLVSPRIHGTNTPMKLYSYLDSGVPVLATRLVTHTQAVDDRHAMLCEPDPDAMAAAMVELIRNSDLRHRLAEGARDLVAREYSREAHHRKLNRFYHAVENLLGNRHRGYRSVQIPIVVGRR